MTPQPWGEHTDWISTLHRHFQLQGSSSFRGFLLKAAAVGSQTAVGSFSGPITGAQLLTCSQKSNSAVSQTSASTKTSIQATWTADASASGTSIQFSATFVQSTRTFWVAVKSPVLTFTGESAGSSTSPAITTSTTSVNASMSISNAQCGDTKTCFSQPFNCDPSASSDCYFMSAMMLSTSNGAIHYEMTGPSNGYIAFGFSDDQIMGNDDIYICGMDSRGLPTLQHAYSTGKTTPKTISLGDVSNLTATMQNNVISCSFITTNAISTQRSISSNQNYYILFAYGPSSNGQITPHTGTFTSSDKIDFSKVQLLATKSETPAIVKAHGALMLISWMTTGSLGMIVARYLKGMARGHKMFGKDHWFVVHVPVMCVTVAATIIAFIIIFVYGQGWAGGAHPVLGCLIMILSFIQPIIAFLRCGPQHPTRYVFNWTHSLNALVIKILAVAAIFTGLELIDGSDSQWMVKTMSGFTAWECLFYVFMEAHFRWKIHTTDTIESKTTNTDNLLVVVYFLGNIAFLVALLIGIGTATVVP
ncbi:putative ferric-chelate reductase 1 [Anabas testudineus]|uniref:putative ferric-chelate reductase 1 n=1 Tax=Anabas testudineus TaxID=64144 RepID=UPI000E455C34|nr:putative ferric-chelate reductase 1 [Anabas testudineus]